MKYFNLSYMEIISLLCKGKLMTDQEKKDYLIDWNEAVKRKDTYTLLLLSNELREISEADKKIFSKADKLFEELKEKLSKEDVK